MHPEQIAAQIVDEDIRGLTELRRLAGIPRFFEIMCRIVDASRKNGSDPAINGAKQPTLRLRPVTAGIHGPNGLKDEVMKHCAAMRTGITVAKVVERLQAEDYSFVSSDPKVAVGDVLRRATDTNVKISKQGGGRVGHEYEFIGG